MKNTSLANTSTLAYTDYRQDPAAWAHRLQISSEAVALYLDAEVIDLHTDSFLWQRLSGYKLEKRHALPPWGARLGGQVDLPRVLEAQMAGLVWDIPANPILPKARKYGAVRGLIARMLATLEPHAEQFRHVVSYADYRRARAEGKVACWFSIQGGQALDHNLRDLERIPEIHRITLVHLTRSRIGASNIHPLHRDIGLSPYGRDFVEKLVQLRILVDLSHINRKGFFDALAAMPADLPAVVTHTGLKGVCDIWRNIDDQQIRAIAARNGTIGVIYEEHFLAHNKQQRTLERIIDHLAHIIQVAGEDYAPLGSDYDGMITLPRDFPDITAQPILVQRMLDRGWSEERIRKILGLNFLRVIQQVRPD
ncbi:MAG: dipeptidase [Candidatus Sericytochromatia bacterium]